MADITLRDIDNRDQDGAPFEFTGSADQVIAYIDGALRSDLTEPELHADLLDEAIAHVRAGNLRAANSALNVMSVYLS